MKNDENYLKEMQSEMYDSFEMQDPRGKLLFLCDKKKMRWYLKKGLAELVEGRTYRLKIEPKGPGNTNPFFLERLANCCVVCGATTKLSKHHIVPHQYRKVLPDEYKSSNHFDVLCVCLDCHEKYEMLATKLKEDLHEQYGPPLQYISYVNKTAMAINNIVDMLKEKNGSLNGDATSKLLSKLSSLLNKQVSLEEALSMDSKTKTPENFYEYRDDQFMKNYIAIPNNSYETFILMWRQHFIDTMKPQHLSKNWENHYKTFFKKEWR